MKTICTDCNEIVDKNGITTTKNALFPPVDYLPKAKELISKWIIMGDKFAGRYIFFYAAESESMKKHLDSDNLSDEVRSYDNFQNSGIVQLDDKGMANIVLHRPKTYKGHTGIIYDSHVHYKITDKHNKNWLQTEYTVKI